MNFQVVTLFPERYSSYAEYGLPARAAKKGLFTIRTALLRDFADPGRPGRVDDTPYGGGPGMVVQPGPIDRALESFPDRYPVVLMTPRGQLLGQEKVREFAGLKGLTIVSGYYEGVDERVGEHLVDQQISIGRFVLGSGDLAALCLIEAVSRLIPGYMGKEESGVEESEENGLLEYPQYTRPAVYRGWKVPDILLSGDHGRVRQWRMDQSLEATRKRSEQDGKEKSNS